jgi:hypothetical protein
MTTRTKIDKVTFRHSFQLADDPEWHPAGSYLVETIEEQLLTTMTPAYIRLSTVIHLGGRPHTSELERLFPVDPEWLETALARDHEANNVETPPGR